MILVTDGAIIAGKYRLQRPLGRGGMGSVWLARHLMLDADVAIKFISPEYLQRPEARIRFEREARISAQLRAPNVVQVYDYGLDDGTPYIVMELLEGEDLAARLLCERRLDPAAVLNVVQQICKALRRAHEVALVHRDLKPANIFFAKQSEGEEETVKILDFGVAKMTGVGPSGGVTRAGMLLGSPYYMSPEQVRRSKDVDHRSDLWALGVITFQCLSGQLPFQGDEIGEIILEICAADLQLAMSRAPSLDASFGPFFAKAFAREPSDRFQNAQEFATAFAAIDGMFERPTVAASAGLATTMEQPIPALVLEAHTPSGSTLSPTGQSFVDSSSSSSSLRRHGRRIGALLAAAVALASAIVLVIAIVFLTRDRTPQPSNATPTELVNVPPSASAVPETVASSVPPQDASSVNDAGADADSSAKPILPQPPPSVVTPKKGPPTSGKPKGQRHDPTDHM